MAESKSTTKTDDMMLDSFFEAAQANPPLPSIAFLETLEADAQSARKPATDNTVKPSGLAAIFNGLGGWLGGAGLATAMATGVVVGLNLPETVMLDATIIAADGEELAWLDDFITADWEEL